MALGRAALMEGSAPAARGWLQRIEAETAAPPRGPTPPPPTGPPSHVLQHALDAAEAARKAAVAKTVQMGTRLAIAEESNAVMVRLAKELEELAAAHKSNARTWRRRLRDLQAATATAPLADMIVPAEAVEDAAAAGTVEVAAAAPHATPTLTPMLH
eukprot:COSAG05_NODE_145_length_16478_cov_15.287197_15_plen_157_part_00